MDQNNKYEHDESTEFLQGLKDESGFKVPNNYFAKMQSEILDQVLPDTTETESSLWARLFGNLKSLIQPQYALAGIAAIVVAGLMFLPTNDSADASDAFAELSESDLEYYLNSEIDNLNGEELIAILSTDETDLSLVPIQGSDVAFPEIMAEEYMIEIDDSELIDFSEE